LAITKAMSGRFWLVWAGVRSDPRGEHENAMKSRSSLEKNVWPELKKKKARGRGASSSSSTKATESATASLPYLGASRTDPILQYNFNWKSLSVAAGLTLWNFYFRIYAGAIKKNRFVDFLAALVRHLGSTVADRVGSFAGTPQPASPGVTFAGFAGLDFHCFIFHPTRRN